MKVGYLVSRFPLVTETFILREFEAVSRQPGITLELFSLFPGDERVVHEEARKWIPRLHTGRAGAALRALVGWAIAKPGVVAKILAAAVKDYWRHPARLLRTLATIPLALDHARTAQRLGLDHLHAHWATYPAEAAWVIHQLTGIPYSFTPHAHDIFVEQAGLARKLADCEFAVAISQYNRGFLRAHTSPEKHLPLIRYGIPLEQIPYAPKPDTTPASPTVLCVSSFREYKGHSFLIKALAESRGLDGWTLVCAGSGPTRHSIEELARRLGVEGQVSFVGSVDQAEVASLLSRCDLLVQPSVVARNGDTEGIPNTLIEAMAAGVPVVATDVSGVSELVEDGVTGFLAEPARADSLARAITAALTQPRNARVRLTEAARQRVEQNHAIDQTATTLVRAFNHDPAKA
jgi:colanic acid/amylovoran biosynthesis glycosyltransferase